MVTPTSLTAPMDWLQFIASIVQSLAWPLVALAIVLIFREPVRKLLLRLRSLNYAGVEAKFEGGLDRVEESLLRFAPAEEREVRFYRAKPSDGDIKFSIRNTIERPATDIAPSQKILRSWQELALALRELAASRSIPAAQSVTAFHLARILANKRIISGDLFKIINELRHLRNVAGHDSESAITEDQALRYADSTKEIIQQLRMLHNQ